MTAPETKVVLPQILEFDYTFDNIQTEHFLESYLEVDDIVDTVISSGKPHDRRSSPQLGFIFWQVLSTHTLLQVGHLNELSIYVVYTLWTILSFRRINLPSIILNHMFCCGTNRMHAFHMGDSTFRSSFGHGQTWDGGPPPFYLP